MFHPRAFVIDTIGIDYHYCRGANYPSATVIEYNEVNSGQSGGGCNGRGGESATVMSFTQRPVHVGGLRWSRSHR